VEAASQIWFAACICAKLARHPETEETVILCRSADRRSKERAMHDKFSARIDASLKRLAARITRSKKRLDAAQVNRQIGRILQQNQRAAARFVIALQPDSCPAGFRLTVPMAKSACVASRSPTLLKPRCSTASASSYPSACVRPNTSGQPSHAPPDHISRNVVATFPLTH
jgi:hypothetical protein